jgi:translation initiation factor IF-3
MRISRKKRPQKSLIPRYILNDNIKAIEVRILDAEGNNLGVMPTKDALEKAQSEEMDLVEINPKANPPVVQIIDFTHFKYQKEKEVRKQKTNSKVSDIKGVRLSMRIGEHDMNMRLEQAKKFLERGDKVKVEIILRGRERKHTSLANEVILKFFNLLEKDALVKFEQEITRQGSKITAIIVKK